MKPDQFTLLRTPLWMAFASFALLAAAPSFAQPQLAAPVQTGLRPPASAPSPGGLGRPATALGAPFGAPAPNLIGQASKSADPGVVANPFSARLLTKSEAGSSASKLLVAKAQLIEKAKLTGSKTDTKIANLQTGDSLKLSLLTPRQAWAKLLVERPDKIDFDAGTLLFDYSVSKSNAFPGNPSCNYDLPSEGYYMVDLQVEMYQAQEVVTWAKPYNAADSRYQEVIQQVHAGLNHILVSLQADSLPSFHTVQLWGKGRYNFISCEITRLK